MITEKNLAFIDTETTGIKDPRALSISIIRTPIDNLDDESIIWQVYGNPGTLIEPGAMAVNKIDLELIKDLPPLSIYKEQILSTIKDSIIVAHNVSFDIQVLRNEGILSLMDSPKQICTWALAKKFYQESKKSLKLADLVKRFDLGEQTHKSLEDTKLLIALFKKIRNDFPDCLIEEFIEITNDHLQKIKNNPRLGGNPLKNKSSSTSPSSDKILSKPMFKYEDSTIVPIGKFEGTHIINLPMDIDILKSILGSVRKPTFRIELIKILKTLNIVNFNTISSFNKDLQNPITISEFIQVFGI